MPTPILIDANHTGQKAIGGTVAFMRQRASFVGPWEIGGSLWIVLQDNGPNDTRLVLVYQSTDAGVTWNIQDGGGSPYTGAPAGQATFAASASGTKIYALYLNGDGAGATGLRVGTFDTSLGVWSATSADAPATDGSNTLALWDMTVPAAGVCNVVYSVNVGGVMHTYFDRYASGAWGGAAEICGDLTGAILTGMFLDAATGVTHLTYSVYETPGDVRHLSISGAGAVSASDLVATFLSEASFTYPAFGPGVVYGGSIVLPYSRFDGAFSHLPAVYVGTPGSWLTFDLATDLTRPAGSALQALDVNGTLYVFWSRLEFDDRGNLISQLRYSTSMDGISWTAPATFYDAVVDPPTDGATAISQEVWEPSIAVLADGSIGAKLNLEIDLGAVIGTFDVAFYISGSIVPIHQCTNFVDSASGCNFVY